MTQDGTPRILVVDDEPDMLETCRKLLSLQGYRVDVSQSSKAALDLFQENQYDLAILDLKMPEWDGLELMKHIHEIRPNQLIIMITAYATVENAIHAVQSGAFDFIRKPFKMDNLLMVVERALRFKTLQDENRKLQQQVNSTFQMDRIIGQSPALKEALAKVRKVSEVDVPVLLTGESGSGKELFARTIHQNSLRSRRPFVAVDCAALPDNLLESELFGYEKGAFTGAVQSKEGLFETASGGTLFLDEIGELPIALQGKLLRSLQEGTVRRLGGTRETPVNIRLISATNRDVEAMIKKEQLREDLYYRINVVRIQVPSLRRRKEDVPLLAHHFFDLFCSDLTKKLEGISSAALLVLEEYDWPGNIRELRNVIERACTFSESTHLLPQDLPPSILEAVDDKKNLRIAGEFQEAKRVVIEDFERTYLENLLRRSHGNVTEAAKLAGMARSAFHRLLGKYGMSAGDYKQG